MLSKLEMCATNSEAINFESSVAQNAPPSVNDEAYVQFVFDNADYNVKTLDGHGTFHAMGGINCITPAEAVSVNAPVPRTTTSLTIADLSSLGMLTVTPYQRTTTSGTPFILVEDISGVLPEPKTIPKARPIDTL